MLRGVPRGWTKLVPHNGKHFASASLFLLLISGLAGAVAAQGVDVSIESLHISWVESTTILDRPTLELDQALVGDTIRLSASVKNLGTSPAGQFYVDFFFTETISGEHGKIGSQAVIGLDAGEERRPVVTFDSSAFAPGIYVFSAEADPPQSLGETQRCNNFAPLGDCAGTLQQSDSRYQLSLLQKGSHISELSLRGDYAICQMGSLTTNLIFDAHNVGTEAFSFTGDDIDVWGYYRLSLEPPANAFSSLFSSGGVPAQLGKLVSLSNPGDEGFIRVTLDYTIFDALFRPTSAASQSGDVLGKANPVQIRISVDPLSGGTPRDYYLPGQFALAQFYSEVDLWTFPGRSHCLCDDYADIVSVPVDPVVAGGLVFHVVTTASGDRLHVLKIRTAEERPDPWSVPSGTALSSPAVFYDEATQSYRVYMAAGDGKIYALNGIVKETGSFLVQGWVSPSGLVSGPSFLSTSADGGLLIAGSEAGAYVLNALDGTILRSDATRAVTTSPVFSNTTGTMWFASDETVYGLRSNGTECTNDTILDQITSNLGINQDETAVFFGTDSGDFFAIDATASGSTCEIVSQETALLKRTIVGLDIVSDRADAVLYVTSSIGEIVRVEYSDSRGFDDIQNGIDEFEPREISAAPAILPSSNGKDATIIFLTGQTRDGRTDRPVLQGWETDLNDYETVSVWGASIPFLFRPKENGVVPDTLLTPIVDAETSTLLVASSNGYLYAFDLSQFK